MFNKLPVKAKWCFVLFTDVITTVCEKVQNSVGFVYGPCRRAHDRVLGHVQAVYTAVYRPSTRTVYTAVKIRQDKIHGCIRAMYTTVRRPCTCVHDRIDGRVHWPCMYRARVHDRVQYTARTRPCTRPIQCRVHGLYTAVYGVHGRVQVYTNRTWLWTRPIVHSRVHDRVHGRYSAVYVHGRVHTRPCTRPCTVNNTKQQLNNRSIVTENRNNTYSYRVAQKIGHNYFVRLNFTKY